MKIIMAVDYGDARTGLAVCDKLGMLAVGAGCVKCEGMKKTVEAVAAEAAKRKAEIIVVGNPINMNGTAGPLLPENTNSQLASVPRTIVA